LNVGCYLLDNHGYIIVSKNLQETGHFFGEVQGYVMATMVEEGIFKLIKIYDYQAVCFKGDEITSDAIPSRVVRRKRTLKPDRKLMPIFSDNIFWDGCLTGW
jgi:hypothetical protein